jgi:ubiquinone/menaquinone biosynthesis C-methylase UbiE
MVYLLCVTDEHSTREIVQYYGEADESTRLRTGWFQLEHARTQELILRHLPPAPARIIDAGGGAGAYACWLATLGYEVHLIDPLAKHVEQARAASAKQPQHPLASAQAGDARRLDYENESADAVLLLGPLYHLVEKEDRLACLREAHRVLRPGGLVCGELASAASRRSSIRCPADSSTTRHLPQFLNGTWKTASTETPPPILSTSPTLIFIAPANFPVISWRLVFRS